MERDVYLLQVSSGWRIERPSGGANRRGLKNQG